MGKLADPSLKLRCVHCLNTETPLWRAGPDGPKTLCNACGVRYKKGKLVLYKDSKGNITAVQRFDATPVHVPPASKKASRKSVVTASPSFPNLGSPLAQQPDTSSKRAVRKVPSEGSIANATVSKKPRSRSRRSTAGQMPGRYALKTVPDSTSQWRSPSSSPRSSPSLLTESLGTDEAFVSPLRSPPVYRADEPLYQFTDPVEANAFEEFTCLGTASEGTPDAVNLLAMPADPSSAEQFSFAFAGLGRDAQTHVDLPDRLEALRGLVLDRTSKVSRSYDAAVLTLGHLFEQRCLRMKSPQNSRKWTAEDCKAFVRLFSQEQNIGLGSSSDDWDPRHSGCRVPTRSRSDVSLGVMLAERTAYSTAVENFLALMDSSELIGFADSCMVELLAEDVAHAMTEQGLFDLGSVEAFRRRGESLPNKPIAVNG